MQIFDIFNPEVLHLLTNYLVIGLGASLLFIIMYHIGTNNEGFSKKDLLFLAAGPTVGFIATVAGLGQAEVLMYTFTVNMGITGIKEGVLKIGGILGERALGIPLKDATLEQIRDEVNKRDGP